jgi:hypothetical protein
LLSFMKWLHLKGADALMNPRWKRILYCMSLLNLLEMAYPLIAGQLSPSRCGCLYTCRFQLSGSESWVHTFQWVVNSQSVFWGGFS